jgi:hypothetical protein
MQAGVHGVDFVPGAGIFVISTSGPHTYWSVS